MTHDFFCYDCDDGSCISCSGNPTDPGNVAIQVEAKDKSALVRWTVSSRAACSGAVVNYTVFYSTQEGPQLSKHNSDWCEGDGFPLTGFRCDIFAFFFFFILPDITVDETEQFILLKDLHRETQYSVHVEAAALTGTTRSRETLFYTKRFGEYSVMLKTHISISMTAAAGSYLFPFRGLQFVDLHQWNL